MSRELERLLDKAFRLIKEIEETTEALRLVGEKIKEVESCSH